MNKKINLNYGVVVRVHKVDIITLTVDQVFSIRSTDSGDFLEVRDFKKPVDLKELADLEYEDLKHLHGQIYPKFKNENKKYFYIERAAYPLLPFAAPLRGSAWFTSYKIDMFKRWLNGTVDRAKRDLLGLVH